MITAHEVAAVLRRIALGELPVAKVGDMPGWRDGWADVAFRAGGWTVTVFVDGWELDYVDAATAPDGRAADFDHWAGPVSSDERGSNPMDLLTDGERSLLTKVFETSL